MKVTARGWNRNMGVNVLGNHDLVNLPASRDPGQYLRRNTPTIFKTFSTVEVHWFERLSYTGNYRVKIEFTESDVIRLFKLKYGKELGADLLEEHGFTLSPEMEKAVLRKIKLADLTIGDLAAMSAADEAEASPEQPKPRNVFRIRRRT